jgi:hypothetical protein
VPVRAALSHVSMAPLFRPLAVLGPLPQNWPPKLVSRMPAILTAGGGPSTRCWTALKSSASRLVNVRDSNGFSIAKIIIASFVTHFDVLKPPTFFVDHYLFLKLHPTSYRIVPLVLIYQHVFVRDAAY